MLIIVICEIEVIQEKVDQQPINISYHKVINYRIIYAVINIITRWGVNQNSPLFATLQMVSVSRIVGLYFLFPVCVWGGGGGGGAWKDQKF